MDPSGLRLFERASRHSQRTALVAPEGSLSYEELLTASARFAAHLLDGAADLREARVAFLTPPGLAYTAVQWGIWRSGGVAVPLALSHPAPELEYTIDDSQVSIVVATPDLADRVRDIAGARNLRFLTTDEMAGELAETPSLPRLNPRRRAMIIYTSGTTSRPKGAVTTHTNIEAQVESLVEAWGWRKDDHILLVLPLHHVHGIVNVLACALWSGAKCTIHRSFDAGEVWRALAGGGLTLFMAVPTIYSKLIGFWEAADPERQEELSAGCRKLRLMVSGSAALPVSVLERWRSISGHTLLERYGMTEIGMALSNPLEGERRPGHVGLPLPRVEARLVDETGNEVEPGTPGEIEVRGPSVFLEYWQKPDATREAFRDGWFRTGDVAVVENGYYRILGRSSVDILKSGGYKISALEIEEVLLTHPAIAECAVVGIEDEEWGERVSAAVVPRAGREVDPEELRAWAGERLAPYKVPRAVQVVPDLPRNAMGKVVKPEVKKLF